jgi:hypothetical protein
VLGDPSVGGSTKPKSRDYAQNVVNPSGVTVPVQRVARGSQGDVPPSVEICSAGTTGWVRLRGPGSQFNGVVDGMLGLVNCEGCPQRRELLVGL